MLSAMGIDIASVDVYVTIIHSSVEDFGGCINQLGESSGAKNNSSKMLKLFSVFLVFILFQ